jgi:hypothetical protein
LEHIVNYHLISSLARLRSEEILRAAARRRSLRGQTAGRTLRSRVALAVRRVGNATITLSDALAG